MVDRGPQGLLYHSDQLHIQPGRPTFQLCFECPTTPSAKMACVRFQTLYTDTLGSPAPSMVIPIQQYSQPLHLDPRSVQLFPDPEDSWETMMVDVILQAPSHCTTPFTSHHHAAHLCSPAAADVIASSPTKAPVNAQRPQETPPWDVLRALTSFLHGGPSPAPPLSLTHSLRCWANLLLTSSRAWLHALGISACVTQHVRSH